MTRDGVILVAVLCALGGLVAGLSLVAGFTWLRRLPYEGRDEGFGFYASSEPAGGTAPPDAGDAELPELDWRGIAEGLRTALDHQNARVWELEAEVRRWKAYATEMSHAYEGREPRPEEWPSRHAALPKPPEGL